MTTSMHWFPVSSAFGGVETTVNNEKHHQHDDSGDPLFSSPTSSSSSFPQSSSLFCSATEQLFSPWGQHAPWKMSTSALSSSSPSSSTSSFPVLSSRNNHQPQQQQQQSAADTTSSYSNSFLDYNSWRQRRPSPVASSSSAFRRKQQPDSSSGGDRPSLLFRSRSDDTTTAMTEASSSEDYYNNNNNQNINNDTTNPSMSNTAFVTGSELERAMWLVGMNNAAAHQYYNNNNSHSSHQRSHSQSNNQLIGSSSSSSSNNRHRYNSDGDVAAAAFAAAAAVEHAQQSLLDTEPLEQLVVTPLFMETSLESSYLLKEGGVVVDELGMSTSTPTTACSSDESTSTPAVSASAFDLCSPSILQQRYQKRNNVTPVYHRYRHVGEFGIKHDSSSPLPSSPSAKVKYPSAGGGVNRSITKQDSSSSFTRNHHHPSVVVLGGTTAAVVETLALSDAGDCTSSPGSPSSAVPASPNRPLSKYKQHILKKRSSLKEASDNVVTNQNSLAALDRPPVMNRRSKSTPSSPPNLATADQNNDSISNIHDQHADKTTTTTPPATARAMAKLIAERRARNKRLKDDGGSSSSCSSTSVASTDDNNSTTSNPATATRELLSEIVSPSNTMVPISQYIDSDDLLAVVNKDTDDAMSVVSVKTVRAGTFNSASDRKPTTSLTTTAPTITSATTTTASRRVLSPISQPTLDDDCCDTSMTSCTMMAKPSGAGAATSNPISVDECGPIDVDTGEEVDALIDSISIISPLYDHDELLSRLSKQDLLECLREEQRFKGLEFPILDEVDITRGLASYMRGFEPLVEDVDSVVATPEQQKHISAWLDGDGATGGIQNKDQHNATRRELEKYHYSGGGADTVLTSSKRRASCMMPFKPKILSSLMCAVAPQYQLHHSSNHSSHGSVDCQLHNNNTRQRGTGGRTVFSISTSNSAALRSLGQDSRLTFEI